MKKFTFLLFITSSILGVFTSCHEKRVHIDPPRPIYETHYTYVNNSSDIIAINVVSILNTGETKQEKLKVYWTKPLDIEYENLPDFERPFTLFPYDDYATDRIEVSNGKVVVKQQHRNFWDTPNGLFDLSKYEKTQEYHYLTRYTYTFTDDFFKDGEPIE